MEKIAIEILELHPDIQSRAQLDMLIIQEYADLMQQGIDFPPVNAICENSHNWVWDGFHRINAAKSADITKLWAIIEPGTFQDAQWKAAGANKSHGLRRTNADKRRAVEQALKANPTKSNNEIAQHCGVSHPFVGNIRSTISITCNDYKSDIRIGADGRTIDISNIGKKKQIPPEQWEQDNYELGFDAFNDPIPEEDLPRENLPKRRESRPTFNRVNENIEWAMWSWNPVTGCLNNCEYCYARDIANRFYPQGFEPTYHPERLTAPANMRLSGPRWDGDIGHKGVFVCSMADLFGKWVPVEWIKTVLEAIENNPQWEFLLLTKFPVRMTDFEYSPNVWLGTTVDKQTAVDRAEGAFRKIRESGFEGICWLSCEPMLERLTFSALDLFNWIVMGGASRSSQTPEYRPPFDDIVHLHNQARDNGLLIYQKTNLMPGISNEQRIREYPT